MTKISILLPSFNNASTIAQTLESIQIQGDYFEKISAVYIADDCSQDNTLERAKTAWRGNVPLKVITAKNNQGQWNNVNHAIRLIQEKTDWILVLHSDDIAKSNWLEHMILQIETCPNRVGSICSSWDNLMPDGSIEVGEDDLSRQVELISGDRESAKDTLMKGCWWHISGCAIRVQTLKEIGDFNPVLNIADFDWLLRCLQKGWAVQYVPRTLILYRQHTTSVSSTAHQTHRDIQEGLEIARLHRHLFSREDYLSFHLSKITHLIRRMGKSLIQLQAERFLLALTVSFSVIKNMVSQPE